MPGERTCPHCGGTMSGSNEVCRTCGWEVALNVDQPSPADVLPAQEFRYRPPFASLLLAVLGWALGVSPIVALAMLANSQTRARGAQGLPRGDWAFLALIVLWCVGLPGWNLVRAWLLVRRGYVRLDADGLTLQDHRGVVVALAWGQVRRVTVWPSRAGARVGTCTADGESGAVTIGGWIESQQQLLHAVVGRAGLERQSEDTATKALVFQRALTPAEVQAEAELARKRAPVVSLKRGVSIAVGILAMLAFAIPWKDIGPGDVGFYVAVLALCLLAGVGILLIADMFRRNGGPRGGTE